MAIPCRQYIERAVMTGDANRTTFLSRILALRSTRDIERFADELAEVGIEPF
jgi:ABC-type phosphate/phosphonate transport system ATPase subunit